MEPQEARQFALEADAVENGVRRYRQIRDSGGASSSLGRDFLRELVEPLTTAIAAEQERVLNTAKGHKLPRYAVPLLALDPDRLALLTLRGLFNAIRRPRSVQGLPTLAEVAQALGRSCQLERKFDRLRGRERDLALLLSRRNRNPWNSRSRARRLAAEVDDADWSCRYRGLHLGVMLIRLAAEHTGAFSLERLTAVSRNRVKTVSIIRLTEHAQEWLSRRDSILESLATPTYLPMLVPPLHWTGLRGGGYLTNRQTFTTPLVKLWKRAALALLEQADLTEVLIAVNALQDTPWRINRRVLEVLRRANELQAALPGLGSGERQPLPRLLPVDTSKQLLAKRRRERAKVHRLNAKLISERETLRARIAACNLLAPEERFYLPYQLDSRGRVYAIPQTLNPQTDEMGRALLEFADGKPLRKRGEHWLAIHLANTYGLDKLKFADRIQWVRDHDPEIAAVAADPLERTTFWTKADKPWMFLAACFEWTDHRGFGAEFLSHLPVAVDGTCNGLQHLSAMGRDALGGVATNLVPSRQPADLYQLVADRVALHVQEDAERGKAEAKGWVGRINRKVVKRATMTTPYGVTPRGIREQLLEEGFADKLEDEWEGASYLTEILEKSIAEVVVVGPRIMRWLQNVARTLAQAGQGVCWTLPTGFEILHEWRRRKPRRIVTSRLTLRIYEEDVTARIELQKQVQSIAPNFVHSLDAAHLVKTVAHLHAVGLRHFATVHDSYAVHAQDVDKLTTALREEFVRIYREPILENFLVEQKNRWPRIQFEPAPPVGDLDINSVLDSEYFFC